jgi:hypothetical protein
VITHFTHAPQFERFLNRLPIATLLLLPILSGCGASSPTPTPRPIGGLGDGYESALAVAIAKSDSKDPKKLFPMDAHSSYSVSQGKTTLISVGFLFREINDKTFGVSISAAGEVSIINVNRKIDKPSSISNYVNSLKSLEQAVLKKGWEKLGAEIEAKCGPVTTLDLTLSDSGEKVRMLATGQLDIEHGYPIWKLTYNSSATLILSGFDEKVVSKDTPCK